MKNTPRLILITIISALFCAAGSARAQSTFVKADNTNDFATDGSWITPGVPGSLDIAKWDGAYNTAGSLSALLPGSPLSWQGIVVGTLSGTSAGLVSIGGTGVATNLSLLTLGSSGIDMSGANQSLVLNAATNVIGGDQTWNIGTGLNLRLGTTGTGAANANVDGSGTLTIAGGGVVDLNQGSGLGSGLTNFSGKFIVNPGATLRGIRSTAEAWGTSTAADAIKLNGGTLAVGGISGAQGNWTWNTPMTLAAGTTSLIDNQIPVTTTKGRTLGLNGAISGSGNVEFRNATNAADSTFAFIVGSTTNTYSGTTTVTAPGGGELRSTLGTVAGTKTPFGVGDVIVNPGAMNRNQAGGGTYAMTIPNNYKLQGGGAKIYSDDAYQTYSGTISLTGTNVVDTRWSDKRTYLTGVIQNGTSVGYLVKGNDGGALYLDNANTFSGGTTISNGNVYVRGSQGLGTGFVDLPNNAGALYFTPNTAGITSTISAIRTRRDMILGNNVLVDVAAGNFGFNTVAGFWVKASGSGNSGRLTSSSGTLSLSSVDSNGIVTTGNLTTSDHQVQVVVADFGVTPVAVVKTGANSLQFTQPNTFTGGLTVNGGRLNANHASALGAGPVTVNNGAQVYLNLTGAAYTNNFTLNGLGVTEAAGTLGALRFGNNQIVSGSVTAATPTRIHAQDGNGTLSGALLGSANVEKTGPSQLTFSGASPSYTGTLTDAAGSLNLVGSIAGNLVVTDAGTMIGEGTVGGTLSLGSSTGAVIRVQGNTPGALTASGGLTLTGVNTIIVDSVPSVSGPFSVINYGGTLTGGLPNLTLAGVSAFRTPPVLANTGSAITLQIQSGLGLTWTGTNGSAWDLNTTTNWAAGVSEQAFMQMDSVTFDDTSINGTVNISGQLQPSTVNFNNSLIEYTLGALGGSGIVGPGSITKNGAATATLGGANDFTGPITVNDGILKMGHTNAFGRSAGITIASGAQVDISGQQPGTLATGGYTYTIAGAGPEGAGAIVNNGADANSSAGIKSIVLTDHASIGGNGGRFDVGFANVAGFGTITGNGKTLTKIGSSSVGFRGDASATAINFVADGGTIWGENTDNAFGGTNGTLTINSGAWAGTYGTRTILTPVTINYGGTLHNQGGGAGTWAGTITANEGAIIEAGTEIRVAGTLNAVGSMDKTGGSQLTILGTASIAGDVDIQAGTLQVGDMSTNGTIGNPGSITITLNSNGTPGLRYRLAAVDASLSSPVNFSGEYSELRHHPAYPTNKLTLTGTVGTSQYAGILDVETGTMVLGGSASATVNSVRIKGNPTATERGVFEILAGTSLTTRFLDIGAGDRQSGILNQSGGLVNVVDSGNGVRIGHWPNNSPIFASEYNLAAGTLDATALIHNVAGVEGEKVVNVGWDGYGLLNIGGGASPAVAKVVGLRYDKNRASSAYPSMTAVNANGVVEVGSQGILGQGSTMTLLNGGKLVGTASAVWTAPLQIAASTTGTIEVHSDVIVTNTGVVSGSGALTKLGAGTLVLPAVNTYSGATTISAGTLSTRTGGACSNSVVTLAGGTTSALSIASAGGQWACAGLTCGVGAVDAEFNFGAIPPSTIAAPLQVNGNLAINGTLRIRVSGNVSTVGTYPLIKYTGTLSGTPPVTPVSLPVGLVAVLVNNTANKSIDLRVTVGNVLTWAVGNAFWDIAATANWKDSSSAMVTYADGRAVQFDDTASGTSPILVTLDTIVNPGMVTVASVTKDYSISGSGSIAGFAGLAKKGAAKLTLSGTHTYSSGTLVSEGTLQLGDGDVNNGVIAGSIVNDATLAFANPLDQINTIAISGTGAVVKASSGTLNFSTRQTYTGGTTINGGVLDLTAGGGAGGTIRGTATVNTGGTLRLSTGDATGYALTDRIDTINLNGGTLDVNIGVASAGTAPWNQTLGGATINMTGGAITGMADGNIDFFQGASTLNTFPSATPSTISGVDISPLRQGSTTFTVRDGAAPIDLDITSVIRSSLYDDPAGAVLIKAGAGTMRLGADNTFTNGLHIDAGTVQVDGSLASGADVTVNTGGTLDGNGSLYGNVIVNNGGTLSPGTNGIGTLAVYGALTLGAGSTTKVDVDATSSTSDLVQCYASAAFGGSLVVTNHSGIPSLGQSFPISSAGTGNFSSITPPPAPGLAWQFDPASGLLSVVQGPSTTPTTLSSVVSGGSLNLSWPLDHTGWRLEVQTNALTVGISTNWSTVPDSTGTNAVSAPIAPGNPTVFYRLVYP